MLKLGNPLGPLTAWLRRRGADLRTVPGRLRDLWRRRSVEQLAAVVNFVAVTVALTYLVGLLFAHIKIVTQPGPQEYNEPAIWHATWLLAHGRNPYTIQELPGAAYCLGPLYNYVVLAFQPLLGIDYPAHRLIVLGFLGLAMWVMARAMRRAGAGLGIALLSVTFYYWMSLNNIEITARPDTMGLFFFVLGLFVPWARGYTRGSTIFGLLCALIAFHCKSYFAVAGCATLLTYFLVRDRKEACWLGVGFFALLGLTFWLSCVLYPYFYIETVLVQRGGAEVNSRDDISLMHTIMLFERGWPYFLMMVVGLIGWMWRRRQVRRSGAVPDAAARAKERAFMALGASFVIFLAIVYFYMGHNAGAYFTYHLHLLFPLMFVLAAHAARPAWLRVAYGVMLTAFFLSWVTIPGVPDSTAPYRRLERLGYSTNGEVLGIACMTDIFERGGRRVLHNGNTMFMGFAFSEDRALHDAKVAALAQRYQETDSEVKTKVQNRSYAVVLTEFDDPYFCTADMLRKYYDKVEQIDYYTYFGHSPVRVWRPKPVVRP